MKSSSVFPPAAAPQAPGAADFDFAAPAAGRSSAPPFSNVLAQAVTPPRPHQPTGATTRAAQPKPPGLNRRDQPETDTAPAPVETKAEPPTTEEPSEPKAEGDAPAPAPLTGTPTLVDALAVQPMLIIPETELPATKPETEADAGLPPVEGELSGEMNRPQLPPPARGWLTTASQLPSVSEADSRVVSPPTVVNESESPIASLVASPNSSSGPATADLQSALVPSALVPELRAAVASPGAGTAPGPEMVAAEVTADPVVSPGETKVMETMLTAVTSDQPADAGEEESSNEPAAAAGVAAEFAPPPETARRLARAARRAWADALENARGIGGAKSTETMKNMVKQEKVAGLGEQILPGLADFSGAGLLAGETPSRLGHKGEPSVADALLAASKLGASVSRADLNELAQEAELPSATTLQRMNEVITREVKMFKRAGDDLVEVVLTPDAKTQISLKLQWRDGQVEVQARCDLGDYRALNSHWGQLQSAMAQQGVRLSHLSERTTTGFTEFFHHGTFSQHPGGGHRPGHQASQTTGTPSPLTPPTPAPTRAAARSQRLLESWA